MTTRGPKPFELSNKQRKDILKRLNSGETLISIALRYDLKPQNLSNALVRSGVPKEFRSQIMTKKYQANKFLVLKRLSVLPQVDKVLAEFGLFNQKRRFLKDGIILSETKEYLKAKVDLKARLTCNVCNISLKNNRWYKRKLCLKCGKTYISNYIKAKYRSDHAFREKLLSNAAKWRAEKSKKG